MKITKTLPQFAKETALLIVTGTEEADFYLAREGVLDKVAAFKVEKFHYSDREDFGRKGSVVFESGDKFSQRKKMIRRDFLQGVKDNLKHIAGDNAGISTVYVLTPAEVKKDLAAALPPKLAAKVKKVISGNFHKEHPFVWLEKIRQTVK